MCVCVCVCVCVLIPADFVVMLHGRTAACNSRSCAYLMKSKVVPVFKGKDGSEY